MASAKDNQELFKQWNVLCFFFIIFNSIYPFDYNLLTISYLEHSVTILNYEQTYWNKYLWRWRTPPKKIIVLRWVCYTFKKILILSINNKYIIFIFIYITFFAEILLILHRRWYWLIKNVLRHSKSGGWKYVISWISGYGNISKYKSAIMYFKKIENIISFKYAIYAIYGLNNL